MENKKAKGEGKKAEKIKIAEEKRLPVCKASLRGLAVMKHLRERGRITQKELAMLLGVDRKTIDRLIKDMNYHSDRFGYPKIRNEKREPYCFEDQSFNNMDIINMALGKKQISFDYCTYDINKQLKKIGGTHIISPHRIKRIGKFFVLLGHEADETGEDTLCVYRTDLMKNIKLLPKDKSKLSKFDPDFDVDGYIEKNPYLHVGKVSSIVVHIAEDEVIRAIDTFGTNIGIYREDDNKEGEVTVRFSANTEDVYIWALQNADAVKIVVPESLKNRLRNTGVTIGNSYYKTEKEREEASHEAIMGRLNTTPLAQVFGSACLHTFRTELRKTLKQNGEQDNVERIVIDEFNSEIEDEIKCYRNTKQITIVDHRSDKDKKEMKNLSFLSSLHRLKEIEIEKRELTDASALSSLERLEVVDICITSVENIDFIVKLPNLRELCIGDSVKSIEPLYAARTSDSYFHDVGLYKLTVPQRIMEELDMERLKKAHPNLTILSVITGEYNMWFH